MNKKSIIFLHGWGGSKNSLLKLAEYTQIAGYENIVLEMPGHGTTPEMDKPWAMKDFVNWLYKKLRENEISEYILVGHSFGGKIILAGLEYGELKPEKIILIDANGLFHRNSLKKKFWKSLSRFARLFEKFPFFNKFRLFFYRIFIGETDYAKTSKNVRESFKLFNEEFFDQTLKRIEVPTLIVWGRNDQVTPLWMGEKMHSKIKDSELVVFEDTHGLPIKQPEKVSKEIIKFINND
jgi:pimeloyl-ACP methyl ester carboxylesterase